MRVLSHTRIPKGGSNPLPPKKKSTIENQNVFPLGTNIYNKGTNFLINISLQPEAVHL